MRNLIRNYFKRFSWRIEGDYIRWYDEVTALGVFLGVLFLPVTIVVIILMCVLVVPFKIVADLLN